jgi:carbonic anhydrase
MDLLQGIITFIKKAWNWIKKIVVTILNFFKHIVNWFKSKISKYLAAIQEKKVVPVVAKLETNINNALKEGKYKVVKCFYDLEKGKILNPEEDLEIVSADKADETTNQIFKDSDLVILE